MAVAGASCACCDCRSGGAAVLASIASVDANREQGSIIGAVDVDTSGGTGADGKLFELLSALWEQLQLQLWSTRASWVTIAGADHISPIFFV